ncbi:hypothetical protein BX265_6934 [Streptomyces sp. TLI_235]|nr:hypothetical protein [Streptomyces sp. TLI_235]PBC69603.1 hypothetical protein BX265_6934 [Streptomyces sp. TLI_235]
MFDFRKMAFDPGQRRWWDGLEWLTAESENQETTPAPVPSPALATVPQPPKQEADPGSPHRGEAAPSVQEVAEALEPPVREPFRSPEVFMPSPTDEERFAAEAQQRVWRSGKEALWRNDDRAPAVVFAAGFQAKNLANLNLADHAMNSIDPNGYGFVSTSREKRLNWGANYRYMIKAPGGIDVNRTLPGHRHKGEMEIAFPGGIAPRYIKGAYDLDPDGMPISWIPNPGYVSVNGPGQLAKIMKWFG